MTLFPGFWARVCTCVHRCIRTLPSCALAVVLWEPGDLAVLSVLMAGSPASRGWILGAGSLALGKGEE